MAYTCEMAMLLPLPFRRGEGRGEGSVSAVYPAVSFVTILRPLPGLLTRHRRERTHADHRMHLLVYWEAGNNSSLPSGSRTLITS